LIALVAIYFNTIMGYAYYSLSKTASADKAINYAQKAIDYTAETKYETYISSLYQNKANHLVDLDAVAAIELYDKASAYGSTDAIDEGLAKAYLNRAKKSIDTDVNKAIQLATLSLKSSSNSDNKKFLGQAYLKKADSLSLEKPDDAILLLHDAKPYVTDELIKPIINKAGEQIVKNANRDTQVLKLLVQDLDGDKNDEMLAIIQKSEVENLSVQVFKYENDSFSMISTATLNNNLFISAELQSLIKDKPSSLVIRSGKYASDDPSSEVSIYTLNASQLESQGYFYIFKDAVLETKDIDSDGNLDFLASDTRKDMQNHVIEYTFKWLGSEYETQATPVVKYANGGAFLYPDTPENTAKSFLEALAAGADDEITQMTYTGDRSILSYSDLDLSKSYLITKTKIFGVSLVKDLTADYNRGGEDKIMQLEYDIDYEHLSIYVLLAQEDGKWKVYALA
jgi:hypothetical protein